MKVISKNLTMMGPMRQRLKAQHKGLNKKHANGIKVTKRVSS